MILGLRMSSTLPKERTLMHNGLLPPLPLPKLEQTCSKYLMSGNKFQILKVYWVQPVASLRDAKEHIAESTIHPTINFYSKVSALA